MSDTPKTDNAAVYAQEDSVYTPALYESDLEFVPANFARDQERRVAELEKALRAVIPHVLVRDDNVWHQRAFALRILDKVTS